MKKLMLVSLMILGSFSAHANEDSSMVVGIVIGAPTYAAGGATMAVAGATILGPYLTTLDISGEGFKILVEAQEDAAAFVASNGDTVGARLVQAMQLLREKTKGMTSTDMQLAESILAIK
ncbi:hypothetical protein D3C87_1444830 [compost metagenome]